VVPSPPLTIEVEVPPDGEPDLRALPARAGVFVLEGEDGGTLTISVTADLRRRVRARLAPPDDDAGPTRRMDLRAVTRRVRALTVGSPFEADWAYLQLARERMPGSYATLLDRWRGWFVHCDPDARHPRLTRVGAPGRPGLADAGGGVVLGPFPDESAARQAIEGLEDVFDLCRYHHVLVEAPHGVACAYKEMGRCPAPCDGSVTMDAYRASVRAALDLLSGPIEEGLASIESAMREASATLDYEQAERHRRRLESARRFTRPAFRHVERLERFRAVAVMPGERAGTARLILVAGGWIEPWADVPIDGADDEVVAAAAALAARLETAPRDLSEAAVQNIGLVCRHLFRPSPGAPGELVMLPRGPDPTAIAAALRRLVRDSEGAGDDGTVGDADLA
jgi:DNA polymerase-3 subunit epsilon